MDKSLSISEHFGRITQGPGKIGVSSLGRWSGPDPWRVRLAHSRPENHLVWLTSGQGRVLVGGRMRGLGMHSALFLPAHHLVALDLGRQAMGHVLTLPQTAADAMPVPLPQEPMLLRQQDRRAQAELTGLLDAMSREATAGGTHAEAAAAAHAALVAVWLHRQIETTMLTESQPNAAQRLSQAYCEALAAREGRLIHTAAEARLLGVTQTHLTRALRAETGRTASALATEATLHRACRLLCETPIPVQDIARFLGFRSASYFAQFLKRRTGQSASALRAQD